MRIAIIGAGIAGLYCAYKLSGQKVDVYEASDVGGRMVSEVVNGVPIEGGAGVIRSTDKLCIGLLKELGVPVTFWKPEPTEILYVDKNSVEELDFNYKSLLKKVPKSNDKTFLEAVHNASLTPNQKIGLIIGSSYSEMLDSDAASTLKYNNWDEFLFIEHKYGKPKEWSELIDVLRKKVKIVKQKITSVKPKGNQWVLSNNEVYDIVVVTCGPDQIKIKGIPEWYEIINEYYFTTNYLRVYSFFDEPVELKHKICTNLPIRRVIPITDKVVMTVYTDGEDADKINKLKKTELNQLIIDSLATLGIKVPKPKKNVKFYWKGGIPSWRPTGIDLNKVLEYVQGPKEGLYFCGDRYSHHPGWIEGALQSVKKIL
jgi:hypothetical protein